MMIDGHMVHLEGRYHYKMEEEKNLFKPGRNLGDYINVSTGKLIKSCLTCAFRSPISECLTGGWLCKGDQKMHDKCNPIYSKHFQTKPEINFWKPRMKVPNIYITDEDFKID